MTGVGKWMLVFLAFVIFASLYAPQPILPYLATYYHTDPVTVSQLITRIMLLLCFGAVLGGLLNRWLSPKIILVIGVTTLAIGELGMAYAQTIEQALLIKTVEGGAYAVMLPALMTALAESSGSKGSSVVYYVTASVVGSLFGRALGGSLIAQGFHEELWLLLSGALVLCLPGVMFTLGSGNKKANNKAGCMSWQKVLATKEVVVSYLLIFIGTLSFVSVLNYLPFHIRDVQPDISESAITWLYSGYAMGIITSLITVRIRSIFKQDSSVFVLAILGMAGSVALLFEGRYVVSLIAVILLCGSIFILHSGLTSFLNEHAPENRSLINGVYLTVYYLGGALSSTLPGFIFVSFGWYWLLLLLLILQILALLLTRLIPS